MTILREWIYRLWGTLRRRPRDRDLEAELALHLELAEQDARSHGGLADAAARAARLRAGGTAQAMEALRDQRGLPWLEDLTHDVHHGLRGLARSPAFTFVAVATLALGIGANTAIFSVVNAVLLRPLPYEQPDRLVTTDFWMAGDYLFYREHVRSAQGVALYQGGVGFNLATGGEADRLSGARASANLFSTLGVAPLLGRTFHADEEEPGAHGVVMLSHALWRQRFGEDSGIVGREILIDSELRMVVGVMPPSFRFPGAGTQLWIPYEFDRANASALWGEGRRGGFPVARLGRDREPSHVASEIRALTPALRDANTLWRYPADYRANVQVVPLQERMVGDVRTRLLVLLGAVGFVLLVACANVANLLLARASGRQREVAVRQALGATRGRLVRQVLTESAVLGVLGGAAGLALALSGLRLLVGALPADIPRAEEIGVDRWVLGFTLAAGTLTGLAFGIVPAMRSTRSPSTAKTGDRGSTASLGRAAGLLVTGEVAMAVMLVIGAGLLIRSFAGLLAVDPGFRAERLVTARITPPENRYGDPARLRTFYDSVLARVGALPGVRAVEAASQLPLSGDESWFAFETEDGPHTPGTSAPITGDRRVTPGYVRAMGVSLVRGRALADTDVEGAPRVALVNEAMAREHWPGENPIGKRFREVWLEEWTTVVGVVRNVRHRGLASDAAPEIYRPFRQMPARDMSLVVRAAGSPAPLAAALRDAVTSVDATVPVSAIRSADAMVSRSVAAPRFMMLLLAGFAGTALALAAIGIYGVLSYLVSRRTREIGVRMALGAGRADVLRLVLAQAVALAGAGTAVGILAALATTRALGSLLFGVSATDAITFAAVPVLLVAVALLAAFVPASRATRVDPTIALRLE